MLTKTNSSIRNHFRQFCCSRIMNSFFYHFLVFVEAPKARWLLNLLTQYMKRIIRATRIKVELQQPWWLSQNKKKKDEDVVWGSSSSPCLKKAQIKLQSFSNLETLIFKATEVYFPLQRNLLPLTISLGETTFLFWERRVLGKERKGHIKTILRLLRTVSALTRKTF